MSGVSVSTCQGRRVLVRRFLPPTPPSIHLPHTPGAALCTSAANHGKAPSAGRQNSPCPQPAPPALPRCLGRSGRGGTALPPPWGVESEQALHPSTGARVLLALPTPSHRSKLRPELGGAGHRAQFRARSSHNGASPGYGLSPLGQWSPSQGLEQLLGALPSSAVPPTWGWGRRWCTPAPPTCTRRGAAASVRRHRTHTPCSSWLPAWTPVLPLPQAAGSPWALPLPRGLPWRQLFTAGPVPVRVQHPAPGTPQLSWGTMGLLEYTAHGTGAANPQGRCAHGPAAKLPLASKGQVQLGQHVPVCNGVGGPILPCPVPTHTGAAGTPQSRAVYFSAFWNGGLALSYQPGAT